MKINLNRLGSVLKNLIPYFIILISSLCGTFIVFYDGMNIGDDFYYHLPNVLDQYKSIVEGHGLSAISGNLAMGLGVGNRLFYSPLSHFVVLIFSLILGLFGGSLFTAFEVTLVLSVFVSGIFMYRFTLHFTNGNKVAALISSIIFVLYPYRLFDAFCRIAFAEAFSIMFLPLFLMGLYDIIHLKDENNISVIPFVEVILGGSLIYLSHNITALYIYIFGIIYLIINSNKIIHLMKNYRYLVYSGCSILLLVGIASISLVSQFELMGTGLYNLNDNQRMWTTLEQVTSRLNEGWNYSGFLNIPWMTGLSDYMSISTFIIGIVMYILSCVIFIALDKVLSDSKYFSKNHLIISGIVLLVLISLVSTRIEAYLGVLVFYMIYVYINYNKEEVDIENSDKLYKNKLFWFSLLSILVLIYMIEEPDIWNKVPQIMLNIQFPWRLWALVQVFVAIICGLVIHYFNYKNTSKYVMASLAGLLIVTSMPLLEKRMMYERNHDNAWQLVVTDSYLDEGTALGFNKEYLPQVFFDNEYESEYSNSIYHEIKNKLPYSFHNYEDYTYTPVLLEGSGEIVINECFAPNYDMNIIVSEDALIQLPLIYYPGYEIKVTNLDSDKTSKIEGLNIDGLVAFDLEEGNYKVTTDYKGTSLRKFSFVVFYLSILTTGAILVYGIFFENKRKNEDKID